MFQDVIDAKNPALCWSGGLDSTLLLAMLREQNIPVDILQFGRETWTKGQKERADRLIKDWDLKVFSYPAGNTHFIGNGTDITAVFDYAVGGSSIPVLRDVVQGDACIATLEGQKLFSPPVEYDLYIVGTRESDAHYALPPPQREWTVGNAKFIAPLFDYTREDVQEGLKERGLPWEELSDAEDTGSLVICDRCLRAIEPIECPIDGSMIDPQGLYLQSNLKIFRERFIVH